MFVDKWFLEWQTIKAEGGISAYPLKKGYYITKKYYWKKKKLNNNHRKHYIHLESSTYMKFPPSLSPLPHRMVLLRALLLCIPSTDSQKRIEFIGDVFRFIFQISYVSTSNNFSSLSPLVLISHQSQESLNAFIHSSSTSSLLAASLLLHEVVQSVFGTEHIIYEHINGIRCYWRQT